MSPIPDAPVGPYPPDAPVGPLAPEEPDAPVTPVAPLAPLAPDELTIPEAPRVPISCVENESMNRIRASERICCTICSVVSFETDAILVIEEDV
jgi:hypothetical protein